MCEGGGGGGGGGSEENTMCVMIMIYGTSLIPTVTKLSLELW